MLTILPYSASVDGRVYVWKITEGSDEEDKPQITGKIVIAIQITGEGDSVHPRVCWHRHKQVNLSLVCTHFWFYLALCVVNRVMMCSLIGSSCSGDWKACFED